MKAQISQKCNFIFGEIDPIMEGRADYESLPNHLRKSKNIYSTESGALFNRGGKRFLADLQAELDVSGPFLCFSFNSTKNIKYALIFFNGGFAPFDLEDYDFVRDENNNILKITTPYLSSKFFNADKIKLLRAKQSANVLYLTHEGYPFGQIRYFGRNTWTYNAISFNNGPWKEFNTNKGYIIAASATRGNITLSSTTDNPSVEITLQPYQLSAYESIVSLIWTINGVQGPVINYPTDLNINAEMAVKYLLQANVNLQAQGSVSAQTITAVTNQSSYSAKNISCDIIIHNNTSGQDTTITTGSTFTSTGGQGLPIFTSDMVGQYIQLQFLDANTKGWSMDTEGYALNDIVKSGDNYYKIVGGGNKTGFQQPKHTDGVISDGKLMFQYIHSGLGRAQITSFISAYQVSAQVLDYMPDNIKTYRWRMSLIDNITFPNAIDFIDSRMVLGYNSAEGPVKVFSQPDDYLNFSDYVYGVINSESAIKMIIQSEFARINWIKRIGSAIVAGTDNGIVRSYAPDDGVLNVTNIVSPFISTSAASSIPPLDVDGNLVYVSKDRINLYLAQYNFQTNSYIKNNLLKLVKYQFKEKISDICYLDYPFNAINIRLQDGQNKLLFLSLYEEIKGVFSNDMLNMTLSDTAMNFDLNGDNAVSISIYGDRYLVLEEYRNIYDTTGKQPPLDMYGEATLTADNEQKYIENITFPEKLYDNGMLKTALLFYGGKPIALTNDIKAQFSSGATVNISALKIPFSSDKLLFGIEINAEGRIVPKYPALPTEDGVCVVKNVWQMFNTQDFLYGESEKELQVASVNFPQDQQSSSNYFSGELERENQGISHLRTVEEDVKVLTNAPEIIIKNNGANNFCICGILSYI